MRLFTCCKRTIVSLTSCSKENKESYVLCCTNNNYDYQIDLFNKFTYNIHVHVSACISMYYYCVSIMHIAGVTCRLFHVKCGITRQKLYIAISKLHTFFVKFKLYLRFVSPIYCKYTFLLAHETKCNSLRWI